MPLDEREQRMQLFAGFMQQIESASPGRPISVSEVDLSDAHDLRATLTGFRCSVRSARAQRARSRLTRPCSCISATAISRQVSDAGREYRAVARDGRARRVGGPAIQPRSGGESGHDRRGGQQPLRAGTRRNGGSAHACESEKHRSIGRSEKRLRDVAVGRGTCEGAADLTKKERHIVALDVGSTKTCALDRRNGRRRRREVRGAGRRGIEGLAQGPDRESRSRGQLDPPRGRGSRNDRRRAGGIGDDRRGREPRARREQPRRHHAWAHGRATSSATTCAARSKPRAESRLPEDREVLHVLPQEFFLDRAGQHPRRDRHGRAAPRSQRAHRHRLRHGHAEYRHGRESRGRARGRHRARAVRFRRSVPHAGRARTGLLPARYRRRHHRADRLRRRRGAAHGGDSRRRRSFHERPGRGPAHADPRSRKNQARARLRVSRTGDGGSSPSKLPAWATARRAPFSRACLPKSSSRARRNC